VGKVSAQIVATFDTVVNKIDVLQKMSLLSFNIQIGSKRSTETTLGWGFGSEVWKQSPHLSSKSHQPKAANASERFIQTLNPQNPP